MTGKVSNSHDVTGRDVNRMISSVTLALILASLVWSAEWPLWAAAALAAGGVVESRFNRAAALLWHKATAFIGRMNTAAVLSAVFILFLTPLAFLYRLCDRRLVRHFKSNDRDSLFEPMAAKTEKKDFLRQW